MDNKNVFVAIALSMSVLLFWGAFFETPKKDNQNLKTNNQIQKKQKIQLHQTQTKLHLLIKLMLKKKFLEMTL